MTPEETIKELKAENTTLRKHIQQLQAAGDQLANNDWIRRANLLEVRADRHSWFMVRKFGKAPQKA